MYWHVSANEIILVFYGLMFQALHHSAHAAIHVLVARAVFLEAALLIPTFLFPGDTKLENELGLLPLFLCFVKQNEDFYQENYCAVSVGWMFASVCSCREAINDAVEG